MPHTDYEDDDLETLHDSSIVENIIMVAVVALISVGGFLIYRIEQLQIKDIIYISTCGG